MTEAILIEIDGYDKTRQLLDEEPEAIHKRLRPHAEVAAPIPEGIIPAFPDPDENVPDHVPPGLGALMGAFHMPLADDA